jgi:flagellar protein FliT
MAKSKELVQCYAQLDALVTRMLELARNKQWEQLPGMDAQCLAVVRRVQALHVDEQIAPAERASVQLLIERIQANQGEIAGMVRPQLESLMRNLQQLQRQKNLNSAYGPLPVSGA